MMIENYRLNINSKHKKRLTQSCILTSLLPLAACGGSSGGGSIVTAPPPAPPEPSSISNFTHTSANTYTAQNNTDGVLLFAASNQNLAITGLGGNDTILSGSGNDSITAGAGNDMIRSGNGRDTIDAGDGDDVIVLVGITTSSQYETSDIVSPAGSGSDLSNLLSLADLNGRTISEVAIGEIIDGGTGNNTLYIYGTVDLTGVTLTNVTVLYVNSNLTLSPEQLAQFTTIRGDGTSVINIQIPTGNNYTLDLRDLDINDLAEINIDGDIKVKIDDVDDFAGIAKISSSVNSKVILEITDTGMAPTITLEEIWNVFDQVIVSDYENTFGQDYLIYTDDSNLFEDQIGLAAEIPGRYIDSLYLVGDQTGQNAFNVNLSGINLENINIINLSENGKEVITLSAQDIIGQYDHNDLGIFGGSEDRIITGSDWVYQSSNESPDRGGITLQYKSGDANLVLSYDLAVVSGFDIPSTNFTENPNNVFIANDNTISILSLKSSVEDVTVTGMGGDDLIQTGSGDDIINGGDGQDKINGGAGNDIINGGAGNDFLRGGDGDDVINGGADRDVIYGGTGNDMLEGGDGVEDTVSYFYSPSGVNVNLSTNTVSGGDAEGDTIVNFERIDGSRYSDVLTGDVNNNNISGAEGNDVINGGDGNDVINGGYGIDIIDTGNDDDTVQINAETNSLYEDQMEGGAGTDTLFVNFYISLNSLEIDLSQVNATNFEKIQVTTRGESNRENIALTVQDVLDITDANNELIIEGGDSFDTVTSIGQGWTQGADDGQYHTYTSAGATLLIDMNMTQDIS